MTVQFNVDLLERYIAPNISKFNEAEIPDLRQVYDQHLYWVTNHFLDSSLSGAFASPMRQYAFNAIFRVQSAFKDYHEARDLTYNYLQITIPDNPAIRAYFDTLSRWESCFLNWAILIDIYYKMSGSKAFEKGDGSVEQRAYDISNAIKHCGDAIKRGEHGASLTVPVWLENDGFHSREFIVSYQEFGDLISEAAKFANELQNPRGFVGQNAG
ncbi:hypothetical protein DWB58_31565 [candidate division KSB1 bacterium]|nr:hypothetical protein [candidate division KSB1 bacterium]